MDNSYSNQKNAFSIDNKYLNSNMENEGDNRVAFQQNVHIYGWGRNKNGELGLGKNAMQSYNSPQ